MEEPVAAITEPVPTEHEEPVSVVEEEPSAPQEPVQDESNPIPVPTEVPVQLIQEPALQQPAQESVQPAPVQKPASVMNLSDGLVDSLMGAKSFLKKSSANSKNNLYDHLTSVLAKIIQQKPQDAVDLFESISSDVKATRYHPESYESSTTMKKAKETGVSIDRAILQKELFQHIDEEKAADSGAGDIPDICELAQLFEWAGSSVGREESFLIYLAIKKLVADKGLKSVRFFGKILGTKNSYIVVESERKDGEEAEPAEGEQKDEAAKDIPQGPIAMPTIFNYDDLPKSKFQVSKPVPKETNQGVNKYIYWVSTFAGGEWIKLPDAVPDLIAQSRKIRKLFTGDLNAKINSYPPFKGTEADYMRSQIARITASTVISPAGYYKFDEEEEVGENGVPSVILNTEFEWPTQDAMKLPENWAHHYPYILPQGRTTYVNPNPKKAKEDDEEADEGDDKADDVTEPEVGPSLLTPITEDSELAPEIPAWTIRMASLFAPSKFSPVYLRSNLWPGAVTVGYNDHFASIYVGWGLKDLGKPFISPSLPEIQKEYAHEGGPGKLEDIMEQNDPTLEEERAFEEANKKGGNEEQEEGQEEEEEA